MTLRDMTRPQFRAALKRNGFRSPVMFWVEHCDIPGVSFPLTIRGDGKLMRRETIADLIQRRNEELDRRRKEAKQ